MSSDKIERAVILGAVPVQPRLKAYLRPGDLILACDAGVRNAAVLGVRPGLIIGDFDSMPAPKAPSAPVITLPHVKDDTDTHYAARWLIEHGCSAVTILGALGGARLDQTLATIATGLYLAQNGVQVLLADENTELRYLLPGRPLALRQDATAPWRFFSLFPLEGTLAGVDIEGARYPLRGATLTAAYPLGVSNEFAAPTATLRCAAGCGLAALIR